MFRFGNRFHSRARDCFGVSLANILIGLGDEETAEHVQKGFREPPEGNPLILGGGRTHLGCVTRLIRDLTGGRYKGTLWTDYDPLATGAGHDELFTHFWSGETAELARRTFEEEKAAGNLVFGDPLALYSSPGIFFIPGHYVANPNGSTIVDDGAVLHATPERLAVVRGAVTVRRAA